MELHVFDTEIDLAAQAADLITSILNTTVATFGTATIAFTGGSSPLSTYQALVKKEIDWGHVSCFLSDERVVPQDSTASNTLKLRQTLIDQISIPNQNLYFPPVNFKNPDDIAKQYQEELIDVFQSTDPQFDVLLLGVGQDGHTASIFPNSQEAIHPQDQLIIPVTDSPKPPPNRISFTYRLINQARHVIIFALGESKAPVIAKVINNNPSRTEIPVIGVNPKSGELHWFLDTKAAKEIYK
jgi:6-phosphogluconolactonase